MEGYTSQDNTKKDSFEERVEEYAKQILNISDIKEAKKIIRNIFITEQKACLNDKIKRNSGNEQKISQEDIIQMFKEYKKYSILEIYNFNNIEKEIKDFIKLNIGSFKEGTNIFFIESSKDNPFVIEADIDIMNNINPVENINIYYIPSDNDLLTRFNMKHEFITPDKIKK